MRNWAATLRKASFRGVSFFVESDDFAGGKRIARHEYAGGRFTYLEEMGLATSSIDVTAYLLGDDCDTAARRLIDACQAAGPGRLVLPVDAGKLVHVENFSRVHERDRRGYIAFGFTAVPVGNQPGAVLGVGDVAQVFGGGIAAAARAFGGMF